MAINGVASRLYILSLGGLSKRRETNISNTPNTCSPDARRGDDNGKQGRQWKRLGRILGAHESHPRPSSNSMLEI